MAQILGIDLGTSSIKASLLDAASGEVLAKAQSPARQEMPIQVPQSGWAEQDPATWWKHTEKAISVLARKTSLKEVRAIGMSYQMHGLVLIDQQGQPVRQSIIWCDSRAVDLGNRAAHTLGDQVMASSILNSPGNFTASKWAWVQALEPQVLAKATTAFLPGDYLAYRLTGERSTTACGLSEMMLWDFQQRRIARPVLEHYELTEELLPPLVPTFGNQGAVQQHLIEKFGLHPAASVCYRAGDQPNNAYSLKVLQPGETAATAGTSGVIYRVSDEAKFDPEQRVNTFLHVNDQTAAKRLGILLCINGTGSAYAWLKRMFGAAGVVPGYAQINAWAGQSEVGSKGLLFYPWGNGAERLLSNRQPGAAFQHLDFNLHGVAQMAASVQDGVAAAMAFGNETLTLLGGKTEVVRAGRANLFLSDRFCQAVSQLLNTRLELFATDGATGAAQAAGVGAGIYASHEEALSSLMPIQEFNPRDELTDAYDTFFDNWSAGLPQP